MPRFPHVKQTDLMDCGPTCLKMVTKFHGKNYPIQLLRDLAYIGKQGVSFLGISHAAEKIGFHTLSVQIDFETLRKDVVLPCIAHWNQNHYVVVYKVTKNKVYIADPGTSLLTYSREEFCSHWANTESGTSKEGFVLMLETTPSFYENDLEEEQGSNKRRGVGFFFHYLRPYQRFFLQLIFGLFASSLIALTLPFLSQSMIDYGVSHQSMDFVYIILAAQLMLFVGKMSIELVRSWILLYISARVNVLIISDFLAKLMRLPIAFFDSKNMGDIMRRIRDHDRIEVFLTATSLDILFSIVNLLLFGVILLSYSGAIFIVFVLSSVVYVGWIMLFMRKRKVLDYKKFNKLSANQVTEYQLIMGMQEIKLNNCETQKRWEWEHIQAQLFNIKVSGLTLSQWQNSGALFINELKNIIISFMAAQSVVSGDMTLGMMLAITYILGQLNSPLLHLIEFFQKGQDAQISLERLSEIHQMKEENVLSEVFMMPEKADLVLRNVSFRYGDKTASWILKNINLTIPHQKVTAIVGASGSGKTTLLKLLLKVYDPEEGEIMLDKTDIKFISSTVWHDLCGAVMQDGFIFGDTIAKNIALGVDTIDKTRLIKAVEIANVRETIEKLPLNYNTKIGAVGVGLSQGQKQRILIARAIYKNPEYLFFDEATSALDANNEKAITEKLNEYLRGKTTVIIAHRLSTVREADQIIVMEAGEIAEIGNHETLVALKGKYYELVRNQLELGN